MDKVIGRLLAGQRAMLIAKLSAPTAHEIINPVSAVVNLGALVQHILKEDEIPKERIPDVREFMSQIVSEAGRAGKYASELLAFARASNRTPGRINLGEMIRQTQAAASHLFKVEDVSVEFELAESLPWISGNQTQVQQAMLNVIVNAVEALEGSPERRVSIGSRIEAQQVILTVEDSGPGIAKDILPKIFEPFFTTRTKPENLGLGLTIARDIMRRHNGAIEAANKPAGGMTFSLMLPITPGRKP